MTPDDLDILKEHIVTVIKSTVNGKIDAIEKKIDQHNFKHEADLVEIKEHIAETKPVIEAYKGLNTAGNLVKWIAGVGTAIGVLWVMAMQIFKN